MSRELIKRNAGVLLAVAVLWAVAGAIGMVVYTQMGVPTVAVAANPCNPGGAKANPCNPGGAKANPCNPCGAKANPCNPCNPCASKANPCNPCASKANPCNPCSAKGKTNPCNPCNPCASKTNLCNPCASKANPCNPCSAKGKVNPCNPCASKTNPCNPCASKANPCNPCGAMANPCNPCGGGQVQATRARLEFGTDYMSNKFEKTTGFVSSASHGNRLVVTYVSPPAAAQVYRENAAKVRSGNTANMKSFPQGTVIVKESFQKTREGAPAAKGPIFVMKKEESGYDPSGNNWRYGFAQPDMRLIGEGFTGPVAFCKACHAAMKNQDFVYAVDR